MQTVVAQIPGKYWTLNGAADAYCRANFSPGTKRTALNENSEFKVSADGKWYRVSRDSFGFLIWRL